MCSRALQKNGKPFTWWKTHTEAIWREDWLHLVFISVCTGHLFPSWLGSQIHQDIETSKDRWWKHGRQVVDLEGIQSVELCLLGRWKWCKNFMKLEDKFKAEWGTHFRTHGWWHLVALPWILNLLMSKLKLLFIVELTGFPPHFGQVWLGLDCGETCCYQKQYTRAPQIFLPSVAETAVCLPIFGLFKFIVVWVSWNKTIILKLPFPLGMTVWLLYSG